MILEEIRALAIRGSAAPSCACKRLHTQIRAIVERAMERKSGLLFDYIEAQKRFRDSFSGKGERTAKIVKTIAEKLSKILDNTEDPYEWADIIALAIDGAVSSGVDPDVLTGALLSKQAVDMTKK